jgi:hypothetical protein
MPLTSAYARQLTMDAIARFLIEDSAAIFRRPAPSGDKQEDTPRDEGPREERD